MWRAAATVLPCWAGLLAAISANCGP